LIGKKRSPRDALKLRGIGWEGDLGAMRRTHTFE
jgi:hypothetical protein